MSDTMRIGVSIDSKLLEKFDDKIEEKMYANRSEAIRDLIRDFLVTDELEYSNEEVIGSLTLVYSHDTRGISDKLNQLQHEDFTNVLSSVHLHLNEDNCMEIVAIQGNSDKIKEIADKLISSKGVKHGKLVMTSYNEIE
ncbi:nickel-responsive transcriptional regulator NikR [Methanonatronarchaeum sp. AMET-Sl]|uniref:nickel-responsive transcriptional regulator NikR n=1 Tax=Methanonatronarchaeum sp. AMET-Sl TaxID=3037654 RepID=UPI00244DC8CD|nr:nickel-responsive transcriptional regulator NikR [Methanonatronarchaeum sp. AMET-Sl]WGI17248.1 nickel-responsive transcriptional regulator NikR [Methanonatronarchaeum sp. AMET-Sl]